MMTPFCIQQEMVIVFKKSILFVILILLPFTSNLPIPVGATSSQQSDNPVEQCKKGVQLFLDARYDEALSLLEEGFTARNEVTFSKQDDLGMCALALGRLYLEYGEFSRALEPTLVALEMFRESNNSEFEGKALNNTGGVYFSLGKYSQALDYYQQALILQKESGEKLGESETLINIGGMYYSQGNYPQALDYFQKALIIRREIGDRAGQGEILYTIGEMYYSQGEYTQALEYFQLALEINREVGDFEAESNTLNKINELYNSQYYNQSDDAVAQCAKGVQLYDDAKKTEALPLLEDGFNNRNSVIFPNPEDLGFCALYLSYLYIEDGKHNAGLEPSMVALEIFRNNGNRGYEGISMSNIAAIYTELGKLNEALEYYQKALVIAREPRGCTWRRLTAASSS